MQLQLTIVIPVYGNWWLTARTLRALDRLQGDSVPFETIVVDNASPDETPREMQRFGWARYLRLERNTNFAGGCNAGASAAHAPLVLFLNNDAFPLGDALSPLVQTFDREEVTIAGGALLFEDGVTQGAGFVVLPNAHWHYSCRNLPATLDAVTSSRDAIGVSGAAMAVRTEWFLSNGGFDETYVNGFEDVDLCMRAREQQRVIRYVAESRFAHYEAATAGRFDREADNERLFYTRWFSRFTTIDRTARGQVQGISIHVAPKLTPLCAASLEHLETAMRGFGHPIVRGPLQPHQRIDARFRGAAALGWFSDHAEPRGVVIDASLGGPAVMNVRGAAELQVPWLPCAAPERTARIPVQRSADAACATVAVAGLSAVPSYRRAELFTALQHLMNRNAALNLVVLGRNADATELARRWDPRAEVVEFVLGASMPRIDVACVIAAGLTDECSFGNVVLAQGGLPLVAIASDELRSLFKPDVTLMAEAGEIADCIARFVGDPDLRMHYGTLVAADALRRFSPRRSAIRVIDLLCAARFGLERPAAARSNSPIAL